MNLLNKISYGLYLLASRHQNKDNACIVNTLFQQTSTPEQLSVTVNKQNLTHDHIKNSGICCVAVLGTDTDFKIFKDFGMRSGKDCDKYLDVKTIKSENGINLPDIGFLGFFELKVSNSLDLGTHTQFICNITNKVGLSDKEGLTYSYYHLNIKPKPQTNSLTEGYVCKICGYIHKEKITDDFICPVCKHGSEAFEAINVKNITEKGVKEMSKFVCNVCGYVHEGDAAPDKCPVCHAPAAKFSKQSKEMSWAAEHVVGIANGVREDILEDLRSNFKGECTEVGMYLAMSRVAIREGYPEIGAFYEKAAWEEAEHAAKFAELLGEVVTDSTKKNLQLRADAENGATLGKFELAKKAKELNLDAIHDTVHEMAKDEARHGKGFLGLLNRYFNK